MQYYVTDWSDICCFFLDWDLVSVYEEYCVGTWIIHKTLQNSSEFVAYPFSPHFLVFTFAKYFYLSGLSGCLSGDFFILGGVLLFIYSEYFQQTRLL